jgi:hypothetical protein
MAQPGDRGQLAKLECDAHADHRVERAHEDAGHASDGETARDGGEHQGRREGGDRYAGATVTRRHRDVLDPPRLRGREGARVRDL